MVEERAGFDISLAYIPIAKMEYISRHDGQFYAVYTRVEAAGLGSLVSDSSRRTRVVGRIQNGSRVPIRYHTIQHHSDGTESTTIIEYKDGQVDRVIQEETGSEPATVESEGGASGWDFLSVIQDIVGHKKMSTLCRSSFDAFDGRKQTIIKLGQPVRQTDGLVRCDGTYQRFADPESATAPETPFVLFFQPVGDQPGLFEFLKLENETKFGKLRVVRR